MFMSFLAIARNFFLFIESTGEVYGTYKLELFLAYHRTFEIFLNKAGT